MTAPIPPLVLSPANVWASNDGNWSTWAIKVGSSLQGFHILPSTSHSEVWVPGQQGCTSSSTPSLCAESRGVGALQGTQSLGFQENASSTWEQIGIYEFVTGGDLFQTTETGLYGLDDVVIGEHNTSMELGRTFLQEAYLIVDWERGNFTVSAYKHQSTGQGVIVILPPDKDAEEKTLGLRPGVIAGVAVGALTGIIAIAVAAYLLRRRRRALRAKSDRDRTSSPFAEDKKESDLSELSDTGTRVAEASSVPIHELHQEPLRQQLMSTAIYELPGTAIEQELDTGRWETAKSAQSPDLRDTKEGVD